MGLIIMFVCSTVNRFAQPFTSKLHGLFLPTVLPASPVLSSGETLQQKMYRARENAQYSYHMQAEEYVKKILKPRQEEKRKKRELHYNRVFGHPFGDGHVLGSEESDSVLQDETADSDQLIETAPLHRSRLLDRLEERTVLPEEPKPSEDGVITVALRTPDSHIYRRRFAVTDFVKNVVAYMEAVGYSSSSYCLMLPYPRQCISDRLESSLQELGIVADSTFIIDLKD